jgi:hypothetical protein
MICKADKANVGMQEAARKHKSSKQTHTGQSKTLLSMLTAGLWNTAASNSNHDLHKWQSTSPLTDCLDRWLCKTAQARPSMHVKELKTMYKLYKCHMHANSIKKILATSA